MLLHAAGLRLPQSYHLPSAPSRPAPHFLCAFLASDVIFLKLNYSDHPHLLAALQRLLVMAATCSTAALIGLCAALLCPLPSSEGRRGERTPWSVLPPLAFPVPSRRAERGPAVNV